MTDGILSPEEVTAIKKREDARLRKQKQRAKQKEEATRKKQERAEAIDPLARWQRNRTERAEEYAAILQRQKENLDDDAWLRTYTALLKAGRMTNAIDAELLLDIAACAWLNIQEHYYDDHFYMCTKEMAGHFQPVASVQFVEVPVELFHTGYVVSQERKSEGNLKIANIEWFEFGVAAVRIPKDVWEAFLDEAAPFIRRTMPDLQDDEFAQFIVAQRLERPAPLVYGGVNKNVILPKPRVRE